MGVLSTVLGLVVVVGWISDVQILMTIVPGYVSMKLNTAFFFILSGIIVINLKSEKSNLSVYFLSTILAAFAIASLSQDVFNIDAGIDQLFINDQVAIANGAMSPGRPSPITSLCFGMLGPIFLIVRSSNIYFRRLAQYGLHIVTFLSFIAVLGYVFNVPSFYKLSFFTSMAIHTSIVLFALSIGVSFIHHDLGVTGLLTRKGIGNVMARNLFKKVMPAILVLGFLQVILERLEIVSVEFGIAMFTTCFMLVVLYALWSTARLLNGCDEKRKRAEEEVISTNKNLEKIVLERTEYLTRQNKQLEEFSYIISHNLRGPMGNLKLLLSFYKEDGTVDGKTRLMEYFESTVNNLSGTLDELLEVVTIREESKGKKEKLNFGNVLSTLVENHQEQIMESNAQITSDFSEAPTMEYSAIYLESIMYNLLSNALKYRSNDRVPQIQFKTKTQGSKIELSVRDNGLGIDIEKNGDRMFGLHKTFHKHPDAKGVGLFITKAQVEAMGGKISVESEMDKGATFEIIF